MKIIILLIIISLLTISCSQEITTQNENARGGILLNLDKENTPEEVVLIKVELFSDEFENKVIEVEPQNSNNGEIFFEKVEVGNWKMEVSAFNNESVLIYFGTSNISVKVDEITTISIELKRVNGSSTGSVYISVTWNDDIFNWFDYPANPILKKQNTNFDYKGISQSFVVKKDNKHYMWYTGLAGNSLHIYAATSDDGLNWVPYSTDPVLSPNTANSWESYGVSAGAVILENGLFKMYYTARSTEESDYSPWYIGLAVSEDGFHWSKRQNPVFTGATGQWDLKVGVSAIQIINGLYYMYYTGKTYLSDHQIGIANSVDGINWERSGANPILSNKQSWEGEGYYYPTVIKNNDKYYMIYNNSVSNVSGFGYAESNDGMEWRKFDANPFITSDETTKKWERMLYPCIIELDNEFRLYYTGYNVSSDERAICVLRSFK
ncbi:MAG: hypothetical protein KKF62_12260 [Bacteroidetes bacterium]|nr:hypothetical protein [Bacteroidota bacterium]MBU1116636.1 hypothetical protein [Bacteroidota bacterium]MBU1797753.1 hypothetical protein [Bacteroidota bacterium]